MPPPSERPRGTVSHSGMGRPPAVIPETATRWPYLSRPLLAGLSLLTILPTTALSEPWVVEQGAPTQRAAKPPRTPSTYIGSVMALLATFEDAGVLPPEGTPQANGIIKAAIQFQSAFLKSSHPAITQFFADAHRIKLGPRAEEVEASFRQSGWSADTFDAVMMAGQSDNAWSEGLHDAFREFNVGRQDFDILAQLYRQSTTAFSTQGKTFQEVYAQHRREMPGGQSQ